MKLIEFEADGKVFFINPDQITHIEGQEGGDDGDYINICMNSLDSAGRSIILTFRDEEAKRLFHIFRSPLD